MLFLVQWKVALSEAAAAAAKLGCVEEFEGELIVFVEFFAGLIGEALGKHPRLHEPGNVEW